MKEVERELLREECNTRLGGRSPKNNQCEISINQTENLRSDGNVVVIDFRKLEICDWRDWQWKSQLGIPLGKNLT